MTFNPQMQFLIPCSARANCVRVLIAAMSSSTPCSADTINVIALPRVYLQRISGRCEECGGVECGYAISRLISEPNRPRRIGCLHSWFLSTPRIRATGVSAGRQSLQPLLKRSAPFKNADSGVQLSSVSHNKSLTPGTGSSQPRQGRPVFSGTALYERKRRRDRLIRLAEDRPGWVVGFCDET